jgi:zinc protease
MVHDSVFKQKSFDNIKNIHLQQLRVSMEKTGYVATGLFRKNIFGESHPYGYFMTEEMVNNIDLSDCVSYYNNFFKENAFEIVVSGLVDDDAIAEINNVFGKSKYKFPKTGPTKKEVRAENNNPVRIEKTDAVQSTIRLGKKLFTRNHPDYLKLTVLSEVLGGYFGSRLMKNVREEKGLTYGIYSQIVTLLNEGYFVIGTDVKKELVSTALEEIYKEIEILKNTPISDEELSTVKNYMIGSFMGSITTPFSLANKFKAIYFNNLTYDFYDDYVSNIQKINAKDLLLLANKYFDKSAFSEIVVG